MLEAWDLRRNGRHFSTCQDDVSVEGGGGCGSPGACAGDQAFSSKCAMRHILVLMGFLGIVNIYMLQLNLLVALPVMVNHTALDGQDYGSSMGYQPVLKEPSMGSRGSEPTNGSASDDSARPPGRNVIGHGDVLRTGKVAGIYHTVKSDDVPPEIRYGEAAIDDLLDDINETTVSASHAVRGDEAITVVPLDTDTLNPSSEPFARTTVLADDSIDSIIDVMPSDFASTIPSLTTSEQKEPRMRKFDEPEEDVTESDSAFVTTIEDDVLPSLKDLPSTSPDGFTLRPLSDVITPPALVNTQGTTQSRLEETTSISPEEVAVTILSTSAVTAPQIEVATLEGVTPTALPRHSTPLSNTEAKTTSSTPIIKSTTPISNSTTPAPTESTSVTQNSFVPTSAAIVTASLLDATSTVSTQSTSPQSINAPVTVPANDISTNSPTTKTSTTSSQLPTTQINARTSTVLSKTPQSTTAEPSDTTPFSIPPQTTARQMDTTTPSGISSETPKTPSTAQSHINTSPSIPSSATTTTESATTTSSNTPSTAPVPLESPQTTLPSLSLESQQTTTTQRSTQSNTPPQTSSGTTPTTLSNPVTPQVSSSTSATTFEDATTSSPSPDAKEISKRSVDDKHLLSENNSDETLPDICTDIEHCQPGKVRDEPSKKKAPEETPATQAEAATLIPEEPLTQEEPTTQRGPLEGIQNVTAEAGDGNFTFTDGNLTLADGNFSLDDNFTLADSNLTLVDSNFTLADDNTTFADGNFTLANGRTTTSPLPTASTLALASAASST
ncbi:hypothetical protein C7M84_022913 [Penaeus vannamei]|uniref:Uncharacterized protein n=1 Tax=Penaeus vannamei TaxID=6689 RepID=A0A423U5F0_PENVA|nr:hypothetical protein C7M84_022913 [Penaeus vannamei]